MGQLSRRLWKLGQHYLDEREQRSTRQTQDTSVILESSIPGSSQPQARVSDTLLLRILWQHGTTISPKQLADYAKCTVSYAEAMLDRYVLADKADVQRDAQGILRYTFPESPPPPDPSVRSVTEKNAGNFLRQEKEVLRLAQKKNGTLTITEIATDTSLSIAEADECMKGIVKRGFAQEVLTINGVKLYKFAFWHEQKNASSQNSTSESSAKPPPSSEFSKADRVDRVRCIITEKLLLKTPEERVRQAVAKRLITEYHYQRENIEIEFTIKMGSSKKRADLVIFPPSMKHTQGNIFAIIETKAQTVSDKEIKEAFKQLQSYVAASMNCQYAALGWKRLVAFRLKIHEGHKQLQRIKRFPQSSV